MSACAPHAHEQRVARVTDASADFLVGGMRTVTSVTLDAETCTRLHVPLEGTLRDVDLLLLDDAGQILAADLREHEAPLVEVCTRAPTPVHVLVRVLSGAGHVRLAIERAPLRARPRTSRAQDVIEEAFVDLDEPGTFRTLARHAGELARRGFTRAEAIEEDVVPETRSIELPLPSAPGTCISVAVRATADVELRLLDAGGRVLASGSRDGDLLALQTCEEGPLRAVVQGAPGTRFHLLVARGLARDVGGPSGLWLGHPSASP